MSSKKCTFAIFIYCIKTDSYCLSELLVVVGKVCENHMPDCPSLLSFLLSQDSLAFGQVQFIAVGTPPDDDGFADMRFVTAAARNIGKYMTEYKVVVDKSTVPVGTADKVKAVLAEDLNARGADIPFAVASNPDFLKEGSAVEDFTRPDRIRSWCRR